MSATAPLPRRPVAVSSEPWLAMVGAPLVLATDSLMHAVMIAIVSVLTLVSLDLARRTARNPEVLSCLLLVIATGIVTCADLLLLAYAYPVYLSLSLLAPAVLAAAVVHSLRPSDVPHMPMRYLRLPAALLALGLGREVVGHGSVLHDVPGRIATSLFPPEMGFFLAALAPGAFIALGLLLAIVQSLRLRTST